LFDSLGNILQSNSNSGILNQGSGGNGLFVSNSPSPSINIGQYYILYTSNINSNAVSFEAEVVGTLQFYLCPIETLYLNGVSTETLNCPCNYTLGIFPNQSFAQNALNNSTSDCKILCTTLPPNGPTAFDIPCTTFSYTTSNTNFNVVAAGTTSVNIYLRIISSQNANLNLNFICNFSIGSPTSVSLRLNDSFNIGSGGSSFIANTIIPIFSNIPYDISLQLFYNLNDLPSPTMTLNMSGLLSIGSMTYCTSNFYYYDPTNLSPALINCS